MSDKLTELLPWYVNGSLSDIDRAWVDAYLADHPEARGELEWYQTLQRQIRESAPEVSEDIGLNQAMARIQAEKVEIARAASARETPATASPQPSRPTIQPSLGARLRDWFNGLSANTMRPALGMALVLVAVQSVVLINLLGTDDETSQIRAVPAVVVDQGPVIKINFKSDATESDIRLLLIDIEGTMAGGPGQLGDWYVRVPARQIDAALAKLKANRIVDASVVMDAVPARP